MILYSSFVFSNENDQKKNHQHQKNDQRRRKQIINIDVIDWLDVSCYLFDLRTVLPVPCQNQTLPVHDLSMSISISVLDVDPSWEENANEFVTELIAFSFSWFPLPTYLFLPFFLSHVDTFPPTIKLTPSFVISVQSIFFVRVGGREGLDGWFVWHWRQSCLFKHVCRDMVWLTPFPSCQQKLTFHVGAPNFMCNHLEDFIQHNGCAFFGGVGYISTYQAVLHLRTLLVVPVVWR